MGMEDFECFERKDSNLINAEIEENKKYEKELLESEDNKKLRIAQRTEIVKITLMTLCLVCSAVTMLFSVRLYYMYTDPVYNEIIFPDNVMDKAYQNDSGIIVEAFGDNSVVTQNPVQQAGVTIGGVQPEGAGDDNVRSPVPETAGQTTTQPSTTAPATQSGGNSASYLININTATMSQLESLPGIGTVKAQAIIDFRNENGPFYSVDELVNVNGIGQKTVDKIRPYVTVG